MIEFPRRRGEGGELHRRRGNVVLILNCSQTMVIYYLNIETCDYYATMHVPPEIVAGYEIRKWAPLCDRPALFSHVTSTASAARPKICSRVIMPLTFVHKKNRKGESFSVVVGRTNILYSKRATGPRRSGRGAGAEGGADRSPPAADRAGTCGGARASRTLSRWGRNK